MAVATKQETLKGIHFLRGLSDEAITKVSDLCTEANFSAGELCQKEGEPVTQLYFIIKGKIGVEFRIPGLAYENKELILYTLGEGGVVGWSALIEGIPWSTMKVLEDTAVLGIDARALLNLCESDNHIGYVLMRNLASLVASRLKRNRMSTLNAIAAIKY